MDGRRSDFERIAVGLANFHCSSSEDCALRGLALGALYALRRASELGYTDRTGAKLPIEYADELAAVAHDLTTGPEVTNLAWLAAFYFNSAIMRLDALGDRLAGRTVRSTRRAGGKRRGRRSSAHPVKVDAGLLKHEPRGVLSVRSAGYALAVQQLEDLTRTLLAPESTSR